MKTIALRFAENFAPEGGTIKAHEVVIKERAMFGMAKWELQ